MWDECFLCGDRVFGLDGTLEHWLKKHTSAERYVWGQGKYESDFGLLTVPVMHLPSNWIKCFCGKSWGMELKYHKLMGHWRHEGGVKKHFDKWLATQVK